MKTILLPVDYSTASHNAARYAAELSASPEYQIGRIILVNSYFVSLYEQILPTPDFVQVGEKEILERRTGLRQRLHAVRDEMLSLVGQAVTIETMESKDPLLRSMLSAIADRKPDFIVIGSDSAAGDGELSEVAEHVIGIARISPVPVLIVPAGKQFDGIGQVLLPCDFRNLACLDPLKVMQEDELWRNKKVMIINVDHGFRRSEPDDRFRAVNASLARYLAGIDWEVNYSDATDTLMGILEFAQDRNADMIIALPGKHSFFYKLTHRSISEALVRNAETPVLILK
jgi:nucleotide-binding universal stress UspA family protein